MGTRILLVATLALSTFVASVYRFGGQPNHAVIGAACAPSHTFARVDFWREWHLQFFTPIAEMDRATILSVYDPATFPPNSGFLAQLATEATNEPAEYLRGGPRFDDDVVVFLKRINPNQEAAETVYCAINPGDMPAAGHEKLFIGIYSPNPFRFEYQNIKPLMTVIEIEE